MVDRVNLMGKSEGESHPFRHWKIVRDIQKSGIMDFIEPKHAAYPSFFFYLQITYRNHRVHRIPRVLLTITVGHCSRLTYIDRIPDTRNTLPSPYHLVTTALTGTIWRAYVKNNADSAAALRAVSFAFIIVSAPAPVVRLVPSQCNPVKNRGVKIRWMARPGKRD